MGEGVVGVRIVDEAAAWCNLRLAETNGDGLRSMKLRPPTLLVFQEPSDRRIHVVEADVAQQMVDHVVQQRRSELARMGWQAQGISSRDGRPAVFLPQLTLSDGAAEELSRGLFDEHNQPPWDTWMTYVLRDSPSEYSYLLYWIPTARIDDADRGMHANPEQCIRWATSEDFVVPT